MNFMRFVAEELRGIMARLGVRTVEEMVGRHSLLKARENVSGPHTGKVPVLTLLDGQADEAAHFLPEAAYDLSSCRSGGSTEQTCSPGWTRSLP